MKRKQTMFIMNKLEKFEAVALAARNEFGIGLV